MPKACAMYSLASSKNWGKKKMMGKKMMKKNYFSKFGAETEGERTWELAKMTS